MTLGLFQKMVLADGFLAPTADAVFDAPGRIPATLDAWLGTLAFAGQIFCDFAGYSTCAIGAALCFGFHLATTSTCPTRPWASRLLAALAHLPVHLAARLPLHPARRQPSRRARTYLALMGTMVLGGLWHGASWNFVVWGGLHGIYLVVERGLRGASMGYAPGPLARLGLA